jgi:hypothetical protein
MLLFVSGLLNIYYEQAVEIKSSIHFLGITHIMMIKWMHVRWARHEERVGEMRNALIFFLVGKPEGIHRSW